GAVLGLGRGEQVYPVPDLPATWCVVAVPEVGVSTPQAFRDWDALALTPEGESDRLNELSLAYASLYAEPGTSGIIRGSSPDSQQGGSGQAQSSHEGDLAENTLLSLVRTGVENDFEQVVFPAYPSLREIKRQLMGTGSEAAFYAALSGSGSALFGLYRSEADAEAAQQRVQYAGVKALMTKTLPRSEYWTTMFAG
ncbi:MAG TPA: 4-(cytidine 5'-diphospho)-2-C-methyl-D-erythritol kinase, partial [Edaphobacter sp.]